MPRKPKKGYFVRGQFVAEGSELDQELKRELRGGDTPSKTELKAQSAELQALGEALLTLRANLLEPLALPASLLEAVRELGRIRNFEGKRRQSQYVGKLMRRLDDEQVDAIRAALNVQRQGSAADTLLLHQAEAWRERLLADDAALAEWMQAHPATDVQHLRTLLRQARKDAAPADPGAQSRAQSHGLAPRQSRTYRDLFQLLRAQLADAANDQASAPHEAAPADKLPDKRPDDARDATDTAAP